MKTQLRIICAIVVSVAIWAQARAVNDSLWLGCTYSVSVKYIDEIAPDIDPPRPKSLQMPEYPIDMMKVGGSGNAWVSFTVTEEGAVRGISVQEAKAPEFGSAAREAVAKWSFSPGLVRKSGKVVATHMRCHFVFRTTD